MSVDLALYDRAREAIRASGFGPEVETKIALFVGAAKTLNATIMAAFELHPETTVAYPFVHAQYCRELEFASLLARVTRWSPDPSLYFEATELASILWGEWWQLLMHTAPPDPARVAYGGLALGHALLARVRLTPLLGTGSDELDPFVVAIRRIEQEGGRMIQAQIRLLKDGVTDLGPEECERIIAAKQASVDVVFARFLEWVAGAPVPPVMLLDPLGIFRGNVLLVPFFDASLDLLRAFGIGGWLVRPVDTAIAA